MEQESSDFKIFDLTNMSILLNEDNGFSASIESSSKGIESQTKNLQSQTSKDHYLLTIYFNLIQFHTLTPLQPQIILFELYISSQLEIRTDLKLSKLFELDSLTYLMEIQAVIQNDKVSQKGYVIVKTQNFQTHLNHHVEINFLSTESFGLFDGCQSSLLLGNELNKWSFAIENFKALTQTIYEEKILSEELQKPIIKNLSLPNDYSYPFIDKMELPLSQQPINLHQRISQLPQYFSQKKSQNSQQKLYICHDMKGGYIEDTNTFRPIRNDKKTHHYRFNYLSQTKIFNYFSHYPITVPPKMWRDLCRKYDVLCLGTFIIEPNDLSIDENDFLTEQFALKLIYIAKKAQFDGYLINIQIPVQNPVKVISWLSFLTQEINKAIPGSQIIWYDSIVINGQIAYQNQLNPYNKAFYQVCNGIFTNYWWKEPSLLTSLKHKIPEKPIYIGNDCFGRNTYGGGKYQIVNAVKKIQQIGKGELSVALFAPGFTYEDDGETLKQVFHQNEVKMYHGSSIQPRKIEKWKITQNGGQGWKQQDDWWVTSYDLCKRQALVKISDFKGQSGTLIINFSCFVLGKGPNYADYFKIVLQLIDYKTNEIYMESVYPETRAKEHQEYVEIKMEIDCSILTDNICVRILQEGKDAQNWAGHYGAKFRGQTVALIFENFERKWISTLPVSAVNLLENYTSFFNKGEGNNFYLLGKKSQPKYSSLSDFDIPPVFILNSLSNVSISYDDSYIGGTCLKFHNTIKLFLNNFFLPTSQLTQRKYTVFIAAKNSQPLEIVCANAKGLFKEFIDKNSKSSNDWKIYLCELIFGKEELRFNAEVRFSNDSGFIGQFSFVSVPVLAEKSSNFAELKIKLSKESKQLSPYHFDIVVELNQQNKDSLISQKLLLKFGQFCGFIKIQKIQCPNQCLRFYGLLRNIPAISSKESELQIELMDYTNGINKILLSKQLSKSELKKLMQKKQLKINFDLSEA